MRIFTSTIGLFALTLVHCSAPRGLGEPPTAVPPRPDAAAATVTPAALPVEAPLPPPPAPPTCGLPADLRQADWPRQLGETSQTESPAYVPGTETIALVPDTQYYVACRYDHFAKQMAYLTHAKQERGLRAAIWLGDLTDHNTPKEWDFFQEQLRLAPSGLPLLLSTGNHDLGERGSADSRASGFQQHFPLAWAVAQSLKVETFDKKGIENAYYSLPLGHFTAGILMLEWSPRKAVVAWANRVVAAHPSERIIVSTHAYLYSDNTRYDYAGKGDAQRWNPRGYKTTTKDNDADGNHDGEMLWQNLMRKHRNIFLTVNGHVLNDGAGYLLTAGDAGNGVHQMLTNYQMLDEGGLGYLRLLEIAPDGKTVRVKTYSPSLNKFSLAKDQNFAFEVEPPLFVP